MIEWKSEKRKISELIPAEYNPRELTEKQAKDLSTSLERFNLADPIVINTTNKIIGGHQRINIFKKNGVSGDFEIDVRVPSRELTDHEEQELNIRLNKNLGQWDYNLLANFDESMLLDIGFESAELDKIFQLDPDEKDDDIPETSQNEFNVVRGDVWQLGRHRLMCGDSTQVGDVEKLMDGKKADMVFTDPPYNVDYEGYTEESLKIKSDNMSEEQFNEFLQDVFVSYLTAIKRGASLYICHPSRFQLILKAIENSSKREDIVLDLFLGSGSTLIACEKTNRICYGMELDEHYCSVIIKRWQEHTGKTATRV